MQALRNYFSVNQTSSKQCISDWDNLLKKFEDETPEQPFDSKFAIEDDEKDCDYGDDQEKSDASPALEKTEKINDTLELVDDVEYRRERHQARVHDP